MPSACGSIETRLSLTHYHKYRYGKKRNTYSVMSFKWACDGLCGQGRPQGLSVGLYIHSMGFYEYAYGVVFFLSFECYGREVIV